MSVDETVPPQPDEASERRVVLSRRTLLKVGWTAPVIMTVAPAAAFAASGGGTKTTTVGATAPTQPTGGTSTPTGGKRTAGAPGTTTTSQTATDVPEATGPGSNEKGIPEQQSGGPQPARINRGFTG